MQYRYYRDSSAGSDAVIRVDLDSIAYSSYACARWVIGWVTPPDRHFLTQAYFDRYCTEITEAEARELAPVFFPGE